MEKGLYFTPLVAKRKDKTLDSLHPQVVNDIRKKGAVIDRSKRLWNIIDGIS
jgi:hypothetical protein